MFKSKADKREYERKYRKTARHRAWRKRHRSLPHIKATTNKWSAAKRAKTRAWLRELKLSLGCVDCGFNKHHVALDFDHVKGNKLFSLALNQLASQSTLQKEVDKCVVRCANCHRIRTWKEKHGE